uniref:Uncharacterized protein n=1 Tax=Trichobilharzia regenti TaxID=157069 RepID=A0AA85K0J4_TRIRE|nr:unnamed protein product [Trichobilharzia regenti]
MSNIKAQTYSTKLKALNEACFKLVNNASNLPSSNDITSLLKFFQNTLYNILKDISVLSPERFANRDNDLEWRAKYLPQLDYGTLYLCVLTISEHIQKLTNQSAVCEHLLRTVQSLIFCLDYDCLEGVPLAITWMLLYFPANIHSGVIDLLCSVAIPLIYNITDDQESYAVDCIPSILTLVFQHVEKVEYHVWVLESFMSRKKDLYKDLLMIIAYGPTEARLPAVCLFFHYWPENYPTAFYGNQVLQPVHYTWESWKPITCYRNDCPNKTGKALAMKMTVNPKISIQQSGKPPPLYVCLDCADALNRLDFDQLVDILLPTKQISLTCESKTCRSKNNSASVTCWSSGCTYLTGNRAIRLCELCHTIRHIYSDASQSSEGRNKETVDTSLMQSTPDVPTSEDNNATDNDNSRNKDHSTSHIYQSSLPDVWDMSIDSQPCMIQSIISLTLETMPRWRQVLLGGVENGDEVTNRAVTGLTCPGPSAPGGPTSSNEMVMLGLSSGTIISSNLSGNPMANTTTVTVGGGVVAQTSFSDFGTAQMTGFTTRNQTGAGVTSSGGIAGVANGYGHNSGAETGAITLLGRYRDEDHKVLAVYGAFLVGEKCRPRERINLELLTRITAGIFNWFLDTIYTAEDELGDLLERIKSEYILKWIQEVQRLHPEAVFAVLLPHPLKYARVGSCWDAISDHLSRVKHGLSRIGSLIPYDIITFETWDFVMPYWLESIRTEVSRMDYPELEILLKKIFDATAGPFPFLPQKVYHFASERFFNTPVSVQDQALSWLEILTIVEVPIPMKELLTMFAAGVASLYLELLLPSSEEYDDEDDNDNVDYTDSEAEDDSLGQNTVSEADWLNEHGILSEKTLHDEDDDIGGEDHLHDGNESDVFSEEFSHSRGDDYYEYLDRNPVSTGNQFLVDENDYTEGDEDPTLDETKSLLSSIIEDKNTSKPFTSINLRKTSKQNRSKRIPPTESSSRPTTSLSVTHEDNSDKCDQSTDSKGDESTQNKLNQRKLTVEKEVKQSNESETPIIHDLPSQQQTKKQISNSPYRMTACLTHMLNIAYRQLKILDPIGHSGYTQETPNLLLWLLGDMLELYWGNVAETADQTTSPGLRNLYCIGMETCILPKYNNRLTNDAKLPVTSVPISSNNINNTGDNNNLPGVNKETDEMPSECIDCLDMLTWFNYARLICQHLAPIRPTPKVTVDFTLDSLANATNFPEYTEWGDFNSTGILENKTSSVTLDNAQKCPALPSSEDLCSVPPVLRLVYLLTRFLKDGTRRCTDHEDIIAESDNFFQSTRSTSLKPSVLDEQSIASSSLSSSSIDQANVELKVFRDPVVLQCILECLAYLCHIGDALRQVIMKAEREEQKLSTASSSSSTSATSTNPTSTMTTGAINTGGMLNTGGSTALGAQTAIGISSLVGLAGNKLPGQSISQDLLIKGQSIQATKTLTSRNCTATPKAQKNFVYYLIHSHLIPSLWSLLKSELSHLASWTVPLILHCLSFPGGFNILWKLIERDFSHHDWRIRFDAIEKVSVLLRELDYYILAGGFSGSAGNKLTHLLSGGSMASSGAVNLFCRLTGVTHIGRTKFNAGRKNVPSGHLVRQHGGTNTEPTSKMNTNTSNNRNPLIQSAIAHAFCCLIGSLDDPNSMIAQYTAIQLASLHSISLACAIQCLEFQFDTVIADRCLILQRMHQLSCSLPNKQIFTWDFFVNRFGLLAIQAQLGNTPNQVDIDSVTDLNGSHRTGEHFQNQFERAAFAINKSTGLKSISLNSRAYSLRFSAHTVGCFTQAQQSQTQSNMHQQLLLSNSTSSTQLQTEGKDGSQKRKQSVSQPGSSDSHYTDSIAPEGIQRSQFKFGHGARRSRPSISSVCGLLTGGLQAGEFLDSNNKFLSSIQQALDLDGSERDTLHQWVRLLLKFMSTVQLDIKLDEGGTSGSSGGGSGGGGDGGVGSGIGGSSGSGGRHNMANKSRDELKDRKALSKAQRHLAFLLGYTDGSFDIPPHKMRNSTVFHAFLAHVAGVLDRNFSMGCCILHQTLVVLQFCASPQRYATDTQPPTFTLKLLEPQVRLHWLQTLLVILYKYEYNAPGGNLPGNMNICTGTSYSSSALGSHIPSTSVSNVAGGGGAFTSSTVRMRKRSSESEGLVQMDAGTGNLSSSMSAAGGSGSKPVPGGGSVTGSGGGGGVGNNVVNVPSSHQFTPSNLLGSGGGATNIFSPSSSGINCGTRGMIEYLIQIVLNTLDSHVHVCRDRPNDDLVAPFNSQLRIREASNVSTDFNTIVETETPPATPVKEEHDDDDDTVVMPGVTINLLPSSTESNEKSHSNSTTGMENDADNLGSTQPDLDDSPGEIRVKKISYEKVSIYGKSGDEQDTAEDKAINDDSNNNNNTRGRRRNISKNEINKRKSFDLNLSSGLTHKNSGYKKMTTSKSTSSISKHLQQQHPQGQHSSNNSLVSLKSKIDEDRNEVKQLGIINDPCTVTRDEQSIVTFSNSSVLMPLLSDTTESSSVQDKTEAMITQTSESQAKGGSNECKSPKKVTLRFPKRGSGSNLQDEKKLKSLKSDSPSHIQSTPLLDSLSDSVSPLNKSKRSNNQQTKFTIPTTSTLSHPLDTSGEDSVSQSKLYSSSDIPPSNSLTVNRSQSVAEGLYLSDNVKLDRKHENIKKNSYTPSPITQNTTYTSVHNHMPSTNTNTLPSLTTAAMTVALTTERCPWCHCILEHYDENTLGLGILCLSTFVHREPSLAAPYLRDMLLTTARLASAYFYSWQPELSHVISPGNVSSIARQFLRCTMYNLAPNGLFTQLFQTHIPDENFFKAIIAVLVDFEDHMSFFQPINLLLESLNKQKSINVDTLPVLLENLANYLENLPNLTDDAKMNHFIASGWTDIIGPLDLFMRKLPTVTPIPNNLATTVRIMTCVLRSPIASNFKTLPDTFSNLLRVIVENVHFRLTSVIELCSLSNRVLKDRTKAQLTRTLVDIFHQSIKFRACIPDENLIKLLQFVLMDAGGTIEPNQVVEGITTLFNPQTYHLFPTGAAELMKPHLPDCLAFISDIHTMHKVKQSQKSAVQLNSIGCGLGSSSAMTGSGVCGGGNNDSNTLGNSGAASGGTGTGLFGGTFNPSGASNSGPGATGTSSGVGLGAGIPSLHEDVLGAHLKSGLAQYVSLELSRSNSGGDQDVLPLLAPGLLSDIKTIRTNKTAAPGLPSRSKTSTNVIGSNVATAGTSGKNVSLLTESGHITSSEHTTTQVKTSKTSGLITKQSDAHPDPAIIIITQPDAVTPTICKSSDTDHPRLTASASASSGKGLDSSTPKLLAPSLSNPPLGSSSDQISSSTASACTLNSTSPNSISPTTSTTPIVPSPNLTSPRQPTYAHVMLAPPLLHTSHAEAPILQYLPWLKSTPPSSQLGPKDFLIMVERVRTLSWLLLGATMNMALTREATGLSCRPIPFSLVVSVADLVKALLSGFPDQQKQSVTVMSSLYHVFLLCQVWTIYCETVASLSPVNSNQHKAAMATAFDFWIRIMPTVLRILSISEDFVIVSGRLLTVIEELIECQSSLVSKLFTLWIPLLHGRHRQLPGNMLKRLQKCIEWEPPEPYNRLLLLLSIPDPLINNRFLSGTTMGHYDNASSTNIIGTGSTTFPSSSNEKALIHPTNSSLPGWTESSLLACQCNSLMGCNLISKSLKECLTEGVNLTGNAQCIGHALAPSAPYANDGTSDGIGLEAGAMGSDLLTSRLVAWLKKHIFVLGRNEDQHSTATHIFVH